MTKKFDWNKVFYPDAAVKCNTNDPSWENAFICTQPLDASYTISAEDVELIASGYEWECPNCQRVNTEVCAPASVRCKLCNRIYKTTEPAHARG